MRSVSKLRSEERQRMLTGLGENDDVVSATERIREVGSGSEEDIRVATFSLTGRGSIEVPFLQIVERLDGFGESLQRLEASESADAKGKRFHRYESEKSGGGAAFSWNSRLGSEGRRNGKLTVVLQRRPPSASIQTCEREERKAGNAREIVGEAGKMEK
jgi:hypothetical protein